MVVLFAEVMCSPAPSYTNDDGGLCDDCNSKHVTETCSAENCPTEDIGNSEILCQRESSGNGKSDHRTRAGKDMIDSLSRPQRTADIRIQTSDKTGELFLQTNDKSGELLVQTSDKSGQLFLQTNDKSEQFLVQTSDKSGELILQISDETEEVLVQLYLHVLKSGSFGVTLPPF